MPPRKVGPPESSPSLRVAHGEDAAPGTGLAPEGHATGGRYRGSSVEKRRVRGRPGRSTVERASEELGSPGPSSLLRSHMRPVFAIGDRAVPVVDVAQRGPGLDAAVGAGTGAVDRHEFEAA